jgi:hypothetical protein
MRNPTKRTRRAPASYPHQIGGEKLEAGRRIAGYCPHPGSMQEAEANRFRSGMGRQLTNVSTTPIGITVKWEAMAFLNSEFKDENGRDL